MLTNVDLSEHGEREPLLPRSGQTQQTGFISRKIRAVRQLLSRMGQGCCSPDMREPFRTPVFTALASEEDEEGEEQALDAFAESKAAIRSRVDHADSLSELVEAHQEIQTHRRRVQEANLPSQTQTSMTSGAGEAADQMQTFLTEQHARVLQKFFKEYLYGNRMLGETFLSVVAMLKAGEPVESVIQSSSDLAAELDKAHEYKALFSDNDLQEFEKVLQSSSVKLANKARELVEVTIQLRRLEEAFYADCPVRASQGIVPAIVGCRAAFAKLGTRLAEIESHVVNSYKPLDDSQAAEHYEQSVDALVSSLSRANQLSEDMWQISHHTFQKIHVREAAFRAIAVGMGSPVSCQLRAFQRDLYVCKNALRTAADLSIDDIANWRGMAQRSTYDLMGYQLVVRRPGGLTPVIAQLVDEMFSEANALYQRWSTTTVSKVMGVFVAENALDPNRHLDMMRVIPSQLTVSPANGAMLKDAFLRRALLMKEGLLDYVYWQALACQLTISEDDRNHLYCFLWQFPQLRELSVDMLNPRVMVNCTATIETVWRNCQRLFSALPALAQQVTVALAPERVRDLGAWLARLCENEKLLCHQDAQAPVMFLAMLSHVMSAMQRSPVLANRLAEQVVNAAHNAACTDWAATVLVDMQAIMEGDRLADEFAENVQRDNASGAVAESASVQRAETFILNNRQQLLRLVRYSAFKQYLMAAKSFQRESAESVEQALYVYALLKERYDLPGTHNISHMQYVDFAQQHFGQAALNDALASAQRALSDEALASQLAQLLENLSAFGITVWQALTESLPVDSARAERLAQLNQALEALLEASDVSDDYKPLLAEKDALIEAGLCQQAAKHKLLAAFGLSDASRD